MGFTRKRRIKNKQNNGEREKYDHLHQSPMMDFPSVISSSDASNDPPHGLAYIGGGKLLEIPGDSYT